MGTVIETNSERWEHSQPVNAPPSVPLYTFVTQPSVDQIVFASSQYLVSVSVRVRVRARTRARVRVRVRVRVSGARSRRARPASPGSGCTASSRRTCLGRGVKGEG